MEPGPKGRWRRIPFIARIVAAMLLGVLVGYLLRGRAEPLGKIGTVLIGLIKALAGPLLFFAVVDAFIRTQVRARSAALMVGISMTNAVIAIVIGLTLSNTLRPGDYSDPRALPPSVKAEKIDAKKRIDFINELTSYVPTSVIKPFLDNSIITIVILAVLVGASARHVKNEQSARGEFGYKVLEDLVAATFRTLEVMLGSVIALVPLAVFGVVASTIGQEGLAPFRGLAAYVGVAVLGLAIQVFVVYQAWIIVAARMPLRRFWGGAKEAVVYALGASSSLATLPVTLRCLDKMKVSPQSARMAACVGTNLNNDGILLYEAMAVLYVAQVYGIQMTVGQQLLASASCLIAGVGIAAVPDAGLISLTLVLATVGLPIEIVPILLTVDWLLSRCRAVTNVSSDILVAVLLDRFDRGAPGEPAMKPDDSRSARKWDNLERQEPGGKPGSHVDSDPDGI